MQGNVIKENRRLFQVKILFSFLFLIIVLLITGCSVSSPAERPDDRIEFVNREKASQARLALGLAYLEQGNLRLAYSNLQKAVNHSPENYQTHLAIALYEQRVGEYDKARESYRRALALAPDDSVTLNHYGVFLCNEGQYIKAHEQFELALNHANYDIIANSLENTGYCYLKQEQYRQAQEFLNRALKYEPVKSKNLLVIAENYLEARQDEHVAVLLDLYQQNSPITAESLWLQIRFAALNRNLDNVKHYGQQLAKNFSQSEQYKQFLAHEY